MARLLGSRSRHYVVLAALAGAAALAACGEDFAGGAGCPVLCPEQNVVVYDTIIDGVSLDTSLSGYPPIGSETVLLLASRGDTLDTRPVVRFDILPQFYAGNEPDTLITFVDSAYVKLRINKSLSTSTQPVTIDVFDVDTIVGDSATAANDTATAVAKLLFRSDRLLGSATFDTVHKLDSVFIALDEAKLLDKVTSGSRLRLGFRARSSEATSLYIVSNEGGEPPLVRFDPSPDTAIKHLTVFAASRTPANQPLLRSDLVDYVVTVTAPPIPSGPYLVIGGMPGQRTYLRFDVPARIIDSSNVLRATLLLTQVAAPSPGPNDSLVVYPQLVTAGTTITDIARSALLLNVPGAGFDSLRFTPGGEGLRRVEIVNALRSWSLPVARTAQRAIVLRSAREGFDGRQILFYSSEAGPTLRPRLRVSYAPVRVFGVP